MDNCHNKDLLYNPLTKRCYKSCEKKNKVTHPVTKKCRQLCKNEKIRRIEDFRCVKPNTTTLKKKRTTKNININKNKNKNKTKKVKVVKVKADEEKKEKNEIIAPLQPELIPPPIQKELAKNFTFLDELLEKGKGINAIDYKSSNRVSEIITIYLYKKYKQSCPMYSIRTYNELETAQINKYFKKHAKTHTKEQLKKHLLQKQNADYIEWNKDKFLTNLKLCLETGEKLVIVPLRVPEHLNMLFIKVATREVIRFEPHGSEYKGNLKTGDKNINTFLEKLTNDINNYLKLTGDKKFIYKAPSEICPRYTSTMPAGFYPGFQSMEGKQKKPDLKREAKGFCLLWSWFFAECVIANPEMDIKNVYKEAWEALKANEGGFATIIRGYFISINEELAKMNKALSIHSNYITENPYNNDIYLAYLNEEREHLRKKPRKPFQDGGKKFILPKANPKAEPVLL